jgi:Mrp family chromosome partitioning ATPase
VTFLDKNPEVAAAAVRSTIDAFQHSFLEDQNKIESQRMGQILTRRDTLAAELKGVEEQMAIVAKGRTVAELEPLSSAALERLKKLKAMLADVQCAIAGGPDLTSRPYTPARTPAQTAADERQRYWSAEQLRVANQLSQFRAQGFGSQHPTIIRLAASAKECAEQVEKCNLAAEERRAASTDTTPPVSLADREASLIALVKTADDEVKQVAAQRSRLKILEDQATLLRASLNETNTRLDALATEATLSGRLTIVSAGDRPLTAVLDNRAKSAAVGAVAGLGLPLGAMVLLGAHRRRYRFADEIAADLSGRVPFVAALPDLVDLGPLGAVAAHCVHDLHVRLQPHRGAESRVYLITSAAAGEGKTSLALSLGLSFAASGFRTLLIDGDLTTRRLTRGLECNGEPGLFEAADGGEPITRRLRCNMSILPVGRCRPQDSWKLAPAATARVLASVKEKFDIIIIDGDPILTGIRASVMASQADGVILNVSCGQEHSLVDNAVRHLEVLGAVLAGAVFNRANEEEFRAALREQPQSPALGHRRLPEKLNRFGPLVATMLSSLSLSRETDLDLSPAGPTLAISDESRQAA